jgi:indolepyruvate ferredoxin oxidoreductase, beta subunit
MENVNLIFCGLGGQGILFMTKIFARAALDKGLETLGAETHGMAQRGGSVVSHLKLGTAESSLVREQTAGFLLALEENEAYRNLPFLAPGGILYVNAEENEFPRKDVIPYMEKQGITYHAFPAQKTAMALGSPMSTNLALMGFFSAAQNEPFTHDELRQTIINVSPDRFRENNLKVFDAGFGS